MAFSAVENAKKNKLAIVGNFWTFVDIITKLQWAITQLVRVSH